MASSHQNEELNESATHEYADGTNKMVVLGKPQKRMDQHDLSSKVHSAKHDAMYQESVEQQSALTNEKFGHDDALLPANLVKDETVQKFQETFAVRLLEGKATDLQIRQNEYIQEINVSSSSCDQELDTEEILENPVECDGASPSDSLKEKSAIVQDNLAKDDKTQLELKSALCQENLRQEKQDIMIATIKAWRKEDIYITKSVEAVKDKVSSKICVCVIGVPGAGKSTALHHAALSLEKDGFIVYFISGPDEFLEYLDISKKQVFVLDDALGVHSISQSKVDLWQEYNEKIRKALGDNTKLLVSIRSQIFLHETIRHSKIAFLDKSWKTIHVDFSDPEYMMGIDDMRNMLTYYMTNQGISPDSINKVTKQVWPKNDEELTRIPDRYRHVISRFTPGKEFEECFPLLCKVFVNTDYVKQDPKAFFKNPFPALTRIFHNIKLNNKHQFCALVLCAIFDGKFTRGLLNPLHEDSLHETESEPDKDKIEIRNFIMSTYKLQCPDDLDDLHIAFNSLTGIYISRIGDTYKISHALFHDIVTYLYNDPIFVFKYGTSEFIHDRVRINDSLLHDPYVIVYNDDKNIERLADRLIRDVKSFTRRGFDFVIHNSNINDERLISCLKSRLFGRERVEQKLIDELFARCMKTVYGKRLTYKDGEIIQYKLIELCVHAEVDCNIEITYDRHPLHISVLTGSLQLTTLFLNNGANIRRVARHCHSVLHLLCRYANCNKLQLLELLLKHGGGNQSVVRVKRNRRIILRELARDSNNVELQEVLPDKSIKVLTTDVKKMYQYVARYRGKLQLVRRIHDNLLTYTDDWDRNILHYTVEDFNVTKYLLGYPQLQKEINHRDRYGRTPFWYVMHNKCPNKKKVLDFSTEDKEVMMQLYKDNNAVL